MNQKKVRDYIESQLEITHETILQDRPCTAIEVTATLYGDKYKGIGFAKVNWPDKWDPEYGINLAREKAIAKISKYIQKIHSGKYVWPVEVSDVPA